MGRTRMPCFNQPFQSFPASIHQGPAITTRTRGLVVDPTKESTCVWIEYEGYAHHGDGDDYCSSNWWECSHLWWTLYYQVQIITSNATLDGIFTNLYYLSLHVPCLIRYGEHVNTSSLGNSSNYRGHENSASTHEGIVSRLGAESTHREVSCGELLSVL